MLTRIGIKNWKRFGDPGIEIDVAPLTLLFGKNSVGKSSILQALLALEQSIELGGGVPSRLYADGRFVQLGSFRNVQHRGLAADVEFRLGFGDGTTVELIPPGNEKTRLFAWTIAGVVDSMTSRKSWLSSCVYRRE